MSTTQKTRLGEAYGSACMTWSTSAVNGRVTGSVTALAFTGVQPGSQTG